MATINTPLLGNPKTPIRAFKALVVVICIATLAGLASLATHQLTTTNHLQVCDQACQPSSCRTILSNSATYKILPWTKTKLLQTILEQSVPHVERATALANSIGRRINDRRQQMGLYDCMELMDESRDRLRDSISVLDDHYLTPRSHANVHTWLSGVLTNHVTCSDGIHGQAKAAMMEELDHLMSLAGTSLALVVAISPLNEDELMGRWAGDFPPWVTAKDRKLLEASSDDIDADVVVAQDGSGNYTKVQDAVTAAPNKSKVRYVIYVKKGTYKEQVSISSSKKNIMLVGDGMNSTIITGSLNVVDGSSTFDSATVGAVGDRFIAQDIWFQNTAGAVKHQAVALRVGADKSVIHRCRIDAYQDTLYAHKNRQFYRNCSITGTIDFIFGNAAVVLQNCTIIARKPMSKQLNMITAQGRTDPNQNTGTSIQNCEVIASSDLEPVQSSYPTYLGRPWKEYSRTVFMESMLGDLINPAGWYPWNGDYALKTLYYGEYENYGPGSNTSDRVTWPGYHVITDASDAMNFTVANLIQGGDWLDSTGVPYKEGL